MMRRLLRRLDKESTVPGHPPGVYPARLGAWAALALVAAVLLTGCIDSMMSPDDAEAPSRAVENAGAKFRHTHLLERAFKPAMGKSASAQTLGLIMAIQSGVDKQRVLDRYRVFDRFRVTDRFGYDHVFHGFAVTVDDTTGLGDYYDFLDALAADPDVLWFEPDFDVLLPPSNGAASSRGQMVPWSVAAIGGQTSWTVSGDGQGSVNVDLYVLDTGISNSDLDIVESLDFRDSTLTLDPADHDGHGTHVAGIAAAVDDTDGLVGVAPGARIHNYKVLDDDGTGDVSMVIAAIEHLTAQKLATPSAPMVVNMSLGEDIGTTAYTAMDEAIQASVATGVVYVVAAGNHAKDASQITPAHVEEVITVGAYAIDGSFAWFSNYGSMVDILAPGEGIVSLGSSNNGTSPAPSLNPSPPPSLSPSPGNGNGTPMLMTGTSMATAHVSGAAALYLGQNPTATPSQVRDALLSTAETFVYGTPTGTTDESVWVGQQPMGSGGSTGALLFVVPDPKALSGQDATRKALFEGWGYTVALISASGSQSAFDTATASADVAYISEEVQSSQLNTKLKPASIGVVNEEKVLADEYGFSSTQGDFSAATIDITDNTHYVTSVFGVGSLTILKARSALHTATGTLGGGAQVLAERPSSSQAALVVIEAGDALFGGGVAAGRRVHLPWGNNDFDIHRLSAHGETLLQRALAWAAGLES